MARLIRVYVDLEQNWDYPQNLTLVVGEQIRTALRREATRMLVGDRVDEAYIGLVMQIAEDTFRHALGRTTGISERLHF